MDTNARIRRCHMAIVNVPLPSAIYVADVFFYKDIPLETINLTEFEKLAIDRVHLLRTLEQATVKGFKIYTDEWKQCVRGDLVKNELDRYARLMNGLNGQSEEDVQARRADHISHYLLKIAYCKTENLRRWYLDREMEWFKTKFTALDSQGVQQFLNANNLNYVPISDEEKTVLSTTLLTSTDGMIDAEAVSMSDFYKVSWLEVSRLVATRKVYCHNGYAYIPMRDLVVCLLTKFRSDLSESLNQCYQNLPFIDDERMSEFFGNFHHTFIGQSSTHEKDNINLADLDQFAQIHYPLCMRHLHESLRANHHLKHQGRLIYGLFLKGIGLRYELFIEFWRKEFSQIMDDDQFNKSHLYNFNHMWGKVGRMVDYSPYKCDKIINGSVGPGESHGCPFKHFEPKLLEAKLVEHGLPNDAIQQIMALSNDGLYLLACTKYFRTTHSAPLPSGLISKPNQYFDDSVKISK